MKILILFDLDGTLTDSAPGITRSVQNAFDQMGYPTYTQEELETFVGPPLGLRFREFAGMTEEESQRAVDLFRERYQTIGMFENSVYPGIPEVIDQVHAAGALTAIATSKPEPHAIRITDHFHLREMFDYLCGATLDESKVNKPDIIASVLEKSGYQEHRSDVIMVGDTRYDMEGAKQMGLTAVGVSYGYGKREDLESSGADLIVDSVEELGQALLAMIAERAS